MQHQLDKNYIKFRLNEPKVSTGIARKFFGIVPTGVYAGFHLKPATVARSIVIYSDPKLNFAVGSVEDVQHTKGWSIAVWDSKGGYNVTISIPQGSPTSEIVLSYDASLDGQNLYVVLRNEFGPTSTKAYLELMTEADLDAKIPNEDFDVVVIGGFQAPAVERKLEQNDIEYFNMKYARLLPYADENRLGYVSPEQIRRLNSVEDSSLIFAFNGELDFNNVSNNIIWTDDIDLIFATRNSARITAGNIDIQDGELAYVDIDKGNITDLQIKTQTVAGYKFDSGSAEKIAPEDNFLPVDLSEFQPTLDLETDVGLTEVIVIGGGSALKDAIDLAGNDTRILINDSLTYNGAIDLTGKTNFAVVVASGQTPIIDGGALNRYGFKLYGVCLNILIKGIEITNMAPDPSDDHTASGIVFGNGVSAVGDDLQQIVLDSLDIHNTGRHCISASKDSTGITAGTYFVQNLLLNSCTLRDISYLTVVPSDIWECGVLLRKTQGVVLYQTTIKDIHGHLLISEDNNDFVIRYSLLKTTLAGESSGINGLDLRSEGHASWPTHTIELVNTIVKSTEKGITLKATGEIALNINHSVITEHVTGIDLVNANTLIIRNSIIHNSSIMGFASNGNSADLDYNDFWLNTSDIDNIALLGDHTLAVDPEFQDVVNDNYFIQSTSALKAGGSDDFDIGLYTIISVDYETGVTAFRKIIFFRKGDSIYSEIIPEGRILTWRKDQVGDKNDNMIERVQKISEFSRNVVGDRNITMEAGDIVFAVSGGLGDFHIMDEIQWTDDSNNVFVVAPQHITDIADGEFVFVKMPRAEIIPNTLTVFKDVGIPEVEGESDFYLLGFRRGANFILFTGVKLEDGITGKFVGAPLPEFKFIRKKLTQDGTNLAKFSIIDIAPASKSSVSLFIGPTPMTEDHYIVTLNAGGFDVVFDQDIDPTDDVTAWYPTVVFRAADAIIIQGGNAQAEIETLDAAAILSEEFILSQTPSNPLNVLAWITGAQMSGTLENQKHFNINGSTFTWAGLTDVNYSEGDVITLLYFTT